MATTLRSDYSEYEKEALVRQTLEQIRCFEHAKLTSCPFKRPRWRPRKAVNYKYDPHKSDTVIIYEDTTKWRQ